MENLTPKEKASDLVNKFRKHTWNGEDNLDNKNAKQCALIAVDEMILVLPFTDTNATLNDYAIYLEMYLNQVKQEIELL